MADSIISPSVDEKTQKLSYFVCRPFGVRLQDGFTSVGPWGMITFHVAAALQVLCE